MADPDEALIEAIAEAILTAYLPVRERFTPWKAASAVSDEQRQTARTYARAAYDAMVAHLGLVEETCCDAAYRDREEFGKYNIYTCADLERSCITRLAQPWPDRVEVDHGSE